MSDSKMEVETENSGSPAEENTEKKNENVTPSASGESASKYPDMKLAQNIHRSTLMAAGKLEADAELSSSVLKQVTEMENPSLYAHLAPLLQWTPLSSESMQQMQDKNAETIKTLEAKVAEAKENAGAMEVLDARFQVARFAAKSMTKDEALGAYQKVLDLPKLSTGKQMDALMEQARIASFYGDVAKNAKYVKQISKLAEASGDWDRRNRLKVYNALCKLLSRDVKHAASLLIDCIATFSCTEMCSYTDFILYTMLSNLLYLPRTEIKKKLIDGPEILGIKDSIQEVFGLVTALYECDYKAYLHAMVEVENVLLSDRFLHPHCGYIMRELHVLGYKQFLDSYKSVTLESMARSFGVGAEFLDGQLSRFIAAGRLSAKIDKFGGVVETNRPDLKNAQYRDMIQQGDLLLNRIQKLARVVDV